MREFGGNILFSATDLMRFMGCAHATTLDLMRLRGEGPEPGQETEDAALLQKHGDAHEAAHLERLKMAGKDIDEIPRGNLARDAAVTRAALAAGREIVFQGAFLSANWGGWSDFLERVNRPSSLGSADGLVLGALCLLDIKPRTLSEEELSVRDAMAADVISVITGDDVVEPAARQQKKKASTGVAQKVPD